MYEPQPYLQHLLLPASSFQNVLYYLPQPVRFLPRNDSFGLRSPVWYSQNPLENLTSVLVLHLETYK